MNIWFYVLSRLSIILLETSLHFWWTRHFLENVLWKSLWRRADALDYSNYKRVKILCFCYIINVYSDVFGYWASETWCMKKGRSFYGTGDSFLFTFDKTDRHKLHCFRWTKKNSLFMNSSSTHIAVGSGGSGFAICLDDELEKGTSFPCDTYGNEYPLCVSVS